MYDHARILKEAAGSAVAPAIGGAGLGALTAHTFGGPAWLGALLGGGAGYLGSDYINDALGLGQPYFGPPAIAGPVPPASGPKGPGVQTVRAGETMSAPPRDPLAISRSPDSMLPETLPKPPAYPGAAAPGSLRPPASSASVPPAPAAPPSIPATPPSHASADALGSLRPPAAPDALSITGGPPGAGPAAPQTWTMDALYDVAAPAQPQTPFGLDPRFLQYLGLAQEFGGMSPAATQEAILGQRPELRGITPSERLGNNQSAEMRALRERHERQRAGRETWSDWLAKWLPGWS